jgi:hypothetical protein
MLVGKDQGTASRGRLLLYKRAMAGQILRISTLCHRLEPQPVRFT